ncbi:MBL fold metallo-hydrolase [Paenibacillus radicis (ex Xue et al. 2023)]|uniref:MBL fold metallo-hydrolase n=1 Tax=Paenibacillus radicis (ex Xue et al. 2023) TaxID=2972489 RepID=A0ABT1YSW5_9BACL|nr:MBL fold metallo-hydrolase [Paenibacillus radicis (ex Xue et al. 2023)]MCR8635070.1 MBL fold metallo-hydrolase [Paenibacillus radicis (ex Xue et al. 2023)]
MKIANGVEMLEISATVMGKMDVIHPTLIWDEDTAVLVDTGFPGQMPLIIEAMEKAGVPFKKLNKIIMSHQDLDHIGSLPAILQESSQKIEVLANEVEKPYIQGDKRQVKITPEAITQALQSLPPNVPEEWRTAFKAVLENPPKASVDRTIEDGEELPYNGGITVINTPGHTPGHISLYHKSSKTLIAADALVIVDGELHGSVPRNTYDLNLAALSIKKLTNYDVESVICYHGGLYKGNANRRIAELANL